MRAVLTLLIVAAVSVALPAAADEPDPSAAAAGSGAVVAPSSAHTLAQVHGGLTAESARTPGRSRDVEMSATKTGSATASARPAPTPRVLRRMSPERVVTSLDPAVRACSSESTTASPTSFGLRVSVAPAGDVEGAELASTMRVPPALLACVTKAVSNARFGAPGAAGASIVLPITVPGRAAAAPSGDSATVTVAPRAPVAAPKPPEALASH